MEEEIKPVEISMPSEVPVQSAKKSNLPKIVILLIVILLIVAGAVYAGVQIGKKQVAGGILQKITLTSVPQPTEVSAPDEMQNWKAYRDLTNKISFKYPSDWVIDTDPQRQSSYIIPLNNPKGFKFGLREEPQDYGIPCVEEISKKQTLVDDVSAVETVSRNSSLGGCPKIVSEQEHITVKFSKNQKNFLVEYSYDVNKIDDERNLFDQILSTFKFLDLACEDEGGMGIKVYALPNGWKCKYNKWEDGSGAGTLSLTSGKFSIDIGAMDIGICEGGGCEYSTFYSNQYFNLKLAKGQGFKYIYELLNDKIRNGTAIFVKYTDMNSRDLTPEEKNELIKVIDLIKIEK